MAAALRALPRQQRPSEVVVPGLLEGLQNVSRLKKLPAVIVQGRYDIVCPTVSADDLHRAWPEARYEIVADAGHSAFEPGIRSRLVAATEHFKTLVR